MVFFQENREDAVHPSTGRFRKKRKPSADMRLSAVQTGAEPGEKDSEEKNNAMD